MNYFKNIVNAINYIEKNIDNEFSLQQVADVAGFSLHHFHRIFQRVIGLSLKSYIRRRRLTEAETELLNSDKKIISIAFDYQFSTPESFSRAFRKQFGSNPGWYRHCGKSQHQYRQERLNAESLYFIQGGIAMQSQTLQPKFVEKEGFQVIGMRYFGANQNGEIPKLWDDFCPQMKNVPNVCQPDVAVGVCSNMNDDGEFEYVAALIVDSVDEVPENMVARTVPAQNYAVFTHKGKLDTLQKTYQEIYCNWLPNSEFEYHKGPDFEWYDHRFDPHSDESEFDIYVPVRKKA